MRRKSKCYSPLQVRRKLKQLTLDTHNNDLLFSKVYVGKTRWTFSLIGSQNLVNQKTANQKTRIFFTNQSDISKRTNSLFRTGYTTNKRTGEITDLKPNRLTLFRHLNPRTCRMPILMLSVARAIKYRISSNKRCGAYLIFMILGAALIRGRRLIEGGAYFEIWKFCS